MDAFTGYGIVFHREGDKGTEFRLWDGAVERINPKAADEALKRDNVRGLYNHNPDHLLGSTEAGTMTLAKDERGVKYDIPFDESDPDHVRVASKVKRGDLKGSSFAFSITDERWTEEDGLEVREILGIKMYDIGPVTYPAYDSTTADSRHERRYVDPDGNPLAVRSCDITEARSSHEAWRKEQRDAQQAEKVAQDAIAEAEKLAAEAEYETLKRRLQLSEMS